MELVKHSDIMHLTGFLAVQPDSDMKVNVLVIIQAVKREPVSIPHTHFWVRRFPSRCSFRKKGRPMNWPKQADV
jgi:hypothetical protein